MARIRTIKPELAAHEGLFDAERDTELPLRFAWCMLFTVADREGRFQWRPRTLKAQILPHDDLDFSRVLHAWLTRGFIVRYRVKGDWYGVIPTFRKHQVINNREATSDLPSIDEAEEVIDYRNQSPTDACPTREVNTDDACPTREVHALVEGKGKEGKEGKGTHMDACPTRAAPPGFEALGEMPPAPSQEAFRDLQRRYPSGTYRQSEWLLAERGLAEHLERGASLAEIQAGVERYRAQCDAKGSTGTQFVLSPSKFFDLTRPQFREPFPLPRTKAEAQQDQNIGAAKDWLAAGGAS